MAWKNYWRHYAGPDYKFYAFAIAIIVLAVIVAYSGYKPQVQTVSPCATIFCPESTVCQETETGAACVPTTTTTTEPPKPVTGSLVIGIKDGGVKLPGLGTATSLTVSVNSIDISEGSVNDTNSTWINVYDGLKSVDIINYQNTSAIVVQKELIPSSYHKVRFELNDSQIKIYYYALGLYNKTYPLLAPSNYTVIPSEFSVNAGQKTVLIFDFDVANSVVREPDSNGVLAYKFKPQIASVIKTTLGIDEPVPNSETV